MMNLKCFIRLLGLSVVGKPARINAIKVLMIVACIRMMLGEECKMAKVRRWS